MAEATRAGLSGAALEDFAGAVDGQAATRAQLTATTVAAVLALWDDFAGRRGSAGAVQGPGGWYDTAEVGRLTKAVAAQLRAGKRQTANVTNAYLTRVIAQTAGGRRRPAARLVDVDRLRSDPFTGEAMSPAVLQHVYGRPADRYRYLRAQRALELERLSGQRGLDDAGEQRLEVLRAGPSVKALRDTRALEFDDTEFVQAALARAESIVDDELSLAMRHQGRKTLTDDGRVEGYRRILRPDLSTVTGVCGLCIAASDRIYYVEDLQPIHTGCHCEVAPILNGRDPGQNLNAADLQVLYDVAGSTYGADLLRVRVKVATHGELGPSLVDYGTDPKLAPQVRKQQARQRRPDAGGTPDAEA